MSRRVPAAWALLGKTPGKADDYGVLAAGPFPLDGLADRAWACVPSTPQLGGAPGPGRLPWAAFTPRLAGGQPWLAVTAVDATEDRDAVGRTIAAIRHVEIPFAGLARDRVGYQTLYRAIPAVSTMKTRDPAEPLELKVDGPDDTAARALADHGCFDRAAALAALLLDGDVVITLGDQDLVPLTDRLAEFDRVLALLPFGMRAGITLASWHDGTHTTAFRLAFGKFATRGQLTAGPGDSVSLPDRGPGADYLRELLAVREEQPDVTELVEHLGRHRRPLGLAPADVTEAIDILRSLRAPGLVVDAARNGKPSIERVANVLRYSAGRLDRAALDVLETHLLARGDSAARVVHDNWSRRSATLAGRLALGELAAGRGQEVERLYGYADKHREVDTFLAAAAEGRTHEETEVPSRVVARLLRAFGRPIRGHLTGLRQAVLERPALARWLLRSSPGGSKNPGGWLGWLDPAAAGAPGWLRQYAVLQAPPDVPLPWPGDGSIADADPGDDADLVLIAALAVRETSFARLTGPWWPFLLDLARTPLPPTRPDEPDADPSRADLESLLVARTEPTRNLAAIARLDTLRLYLDLRSSHYPLDGGEPACLEYLNALWDLWSLPPIATDITTLTVQLLGTLLPGPDPLSEAAVTLLRAVVDDSRIPLSEPIVDAIAEVLPFAPELADDDRLTVAWWTRIERLRPGLRTPAARLRAAVRQPDADPADIAWLCGRSAASGVPAEELAEMAGQWIARHPIAVRDAMFRIVEGRLGLAAAEQNRSYDEYLMKLAGLLGFAAERPAAGLRWRARR